MAMDAPLPPEELDGFSIRREIRRTPYGVAYAAFDREGGLVTLLTPRSWQYREYGTEAVRDRFEGAAHRLAPLRHDSLLPVLGSGAWGEHPYLAQPHVEGTCLSDLVRQGELPRYPELCAGFAGIVEGLAVLHRAGVLHGAIRPATITMTAAGALVLHDYGLACPTYPAGEKHRGLGVPIFLSPEVMLGEAGPATDIYQLGATIYMMLTGHAPFRHDSFSGLVRAVLKGKLVPPSRLDASIPRKLSRLILRCLERDPRKRPDDLGQLAAALRQY